MPDRRIDAIGKAGATSWGSVQLPKGSSNLLKIISGQLSNLKPGEIMHAQVQKAANGSFKVTLKGETLYLKGLPDSLAGKEVSFIAQKSIAKGSNKTELFWIGASKNRHAGSGNTAQHSRQSVTILSAIPAALKPGKSFAARIDNIQGGKMTLSLVIPDAKHAGKNISQQLVAEALSGLKQGQSINVRIKAGNNNARLEILPRQANQTAAPIGNQSASKIANTSTQMATLKLTPGDTTAALVQKRLPGGNVQLNILGTTVETAAPKSIKAGDLLVLRMHKAPASFELLSVQKNATEKAMTLLKANLASSNPLAQNISAMRNLLAPVNAANLPEINALPQLETWLKTAESSLKQPINGERLAGLIRDSGTALEPKLLAAAQKSGGNITLQNDLKSILLQFAADQGGRIQHAETIRALAELGQQGTSRIEITQALNVLASLQGDAMRVELPMLVNQQLVNVQLSIQQQAQYESAGPEESASQDQSYNVLFALELSGLGNMRVDANISDQSVHARIYNENSDVNRFIQEHLPRLESRLQNLGFKEVYLMSSQQAPEAEKQVQFDQLNNLMPSSTSLLDIRV